MKKLSRQFSRQRVSASPADEAAVVPLRRLSVTMATISDLTSLDDKGEHKVLLPPKLRNTLKEATTPRGRHIIARTKEAHVRVVAASRLMDRVSLHSSSLHARTHAPMQPCCSGCTSDSDSSDVNPLHITEHRANDSALWQSLQCRCLCAESLQDMAPGKLYGRGIIYNFHGALFVSALA
jgi:hypothetical protein